MTIDPTLVEDKLLKLIDDVLNHEMPFQRFAKEFEDGLIKELPENAVPDRAFALGEVLDYLESVDWTAGLDDPPSPEAAATGFMSQRRYLEWLRGRRESYQIEFGE